jgi:broad specificity phosphatase PhoE
MFDSDVVQILNRLDLPGAIANPQAENLNQFATQTNLDNSGLAVEITEGSTSATINLEIFDNIEPDTLFGNPRQIGTDILDEIGNGLNAQGFDGPLPSGDYTFALQQLGASSDYTLAFNVSEAEPTPTPTPTPEPTPTPTPEPTPTPTPEPTPGDTPVVSFETTPTTFSEESENNLVEWKWTVTGDFPEEGIIINLDTSGGGFAFAFTEQFAAEPPAEFIDSDIVGFDEETGRLNILLSAPSASFKLYFVDDIIEEGTQTFDFQLVDGEGYTVDPNLNGNIFTITDDNGGPGVGPTVGISTTASDLAEGDAFTVNFDVEGEIPAEGVEILVQSPVSGALGQFDLAELGNITTTGIDGLPTVGDGGGGSFFVTLVEPQASITLSVFDDILAEEPLELPFTVANGELYEVNPDASNIALNIVDEPQPIGPTVGLTVNQSDVVEGDTITLTFNVEGEIPAVGLQVLVNDLESLQNQARSLTEFDVANIELTGIEGFPTPADGDSGFFVTITEPTATITLPVFDEGADEEEESEVFTFEVIDGEAYEVDPNAGSITLNISDADNVTPPEREGYQPGDSFDLVTPAPTYEGELNSGEQSNAEFEDLLEGAALLEELQDGGHVIYFRHARTERDFADQVTADVTDFSTQRVLSEFGIQQSLAIGEGFELSNIPYDDVITSEYGRAIKTAAIAFGEYEKDSDLNFLPFEDYTDEQIEEMRANITPFLTEVPEEGTNTIIVGHDDLFEAGTGIYPDPQGIAYVLEPDGVGGFDIIANLLPEEWVQLSEGGSTIPTDDDDVLNGGEDNDLIAGLLGDDTLYGNGGDDVLRGDLDNRSPGGAIGGNDVISGGDGNDRIGGKGGNDLLSGDAGDDIIWGDAGDDTIMGVTGNDILAGDDFSGGNGADLFVFGNGDGTDLIIDFDPMQDMIGLVEGELTFEDIEIIDSNGSAAINVMSTGETLAVIESVAPSALTEELFMVTPDVSFASFYPSFPLQKGGEFK